MSVPGAAGAMVGSARDLTKWGHALHHGAVVAAPYYAQMIAPTKLPDGTLIHYGFGIAPDKLRGVETIGHGGGIFGFASDSLDVPAHDLFVAILTNSDSPKVSPGTVMRRLTAMAIGKPFETLPTIPLDQAAVRPLLGVYKFANAERTLSLADSKLAIQRAGGPRSEVFPAGANRFHYGIDELSWFELRKDAAGKLAMAFHPDGEDAVDVGTWSGPVPVVAEVAVPKETLAAYAGTYSTPMGKAAIALGGDGKLTIQLAGQPALPMLATSTSEFLVERVGAKISFASTAGKVSGLEIAQGGRTLPGTRD